MEARIRRYFDACNAADVDGIAERWRGAVETFGSYWTIERLICDPATHQAVIEWTHFKTKQCTILRGDEWYYLMASPS